jgi:hypothetical protein
MTAVERIHCKHLLQIWGEGQQTLPTVVAAAKRITLTNTWGQMVQLVTKAYQKAHHLPVTGQLDDATVLSLDPHWVHTQVLLNVASVCYARRMQIHYAHADVPSETVLRNSGIQNDVTLARLQQGAAMWADCSSFVRYVYWLCGFPDPMGAKYLGNGGNSGTMYGRGVHIALGTELPGDVATYGVNGDDHAALVTSRGNVLSNGLYPMRYEVITAHSGPLYIRRFGPFL